MATPPDAPADPLAPYRAKRTPGRTPEPFGGAGARPRLFVVQQHRARRLHWDFRLELDGVLVSWAVPKGPSFDPAEKRLAVHVEDHPVDYADFEGLIPAGNYGAGAVIVWDQGLWVPLEDPRAGLQSGKLLFELHGYKLRGVWTLVRTGRRGEQSRDWLLMKKPDAWASTTAVPSDESVLSGRTALDLETGATPHADAVRTAVAALDAPRRALALASVEPMLARQAERPFSRRGWLFEIKYDGYRVLAARDASGGHLRYRRGDDASAVFPEITRAVGALPCTEAILDGEVVVLDDEGRPSFQRLQRRVQLRRAADLARAAVESPATYFVFDLLAFEGRDLRALPLRERKRLLRMLLPAAGPLRYADHVETRGEEVFAEARRLGLEGVVAKEADAPYRGGRQPSWQKIRGDRTDDFVIAGYTRPAGSRAGFGALLLAGGGADGFVYAGRAGTGFSDAQLAAIRARLDESPRKTPACSGPVPRGPGFVWVEPRLVCEVRFSERTADGLLRQPAFVRLREDKAPEDVLAAAGAAPSPAAGGEPAPDALPDDAVPAGATAPDDGASATGASRVKVTNRDKVFWPDEGYTKGDLLDYYEAIGAWILPYLRDRPLVMTRFPDGITGNSFFQKDAPAWAPSWLRRVRIWSEDSGRELAYAVCDDLDSLLWVVNLAAIALHVWASRVATIQRPDWCILDLDPKTAPFTHVVRIARTIHRLCDDIGLPSFIKTSGQAGLHVLMPLGGQCTFEQARDLGELLAHVVVGEHPDIASVARAVPARGGRVYVDYLQNGHGKLIAAPFGVRPVPGATVSTPLDWSEVTSRLDVRRFTLESVPRRMARRGHDPLRDVLAVPVDVPAVLARLATRLGATPAAAAPLGAGAPDAAAAEARPAGGRASPSRGRHRTVAGR